MSVANNTPSEISTAIATEANLLLKVDAVNLNLHGKPVLQDISLQLAQGHILTVIGLNGSGKTTLLKVILGLLKPDSGRIWRRPGSRIGYMPQRLAVDETLPLTVRRFMQLGTNLARGRAGLVRIQAVLSETGADNVLNTPLQALSGGELQRVLLARALLREPDLLVLDEPVQAVDLAGQYELYDLIAAIRARHRCGILLVSHDLHLVLPASDQVLCMNHHICCAGSPEQVTQHPSFRQLFGPERAQHIAIYRHHHDHQHDHHGAVVNLES